MRISAYALRIQVDDFFSCLDVPEGVQDVSVAKIVSDTVRDASTGRELFAEMVDGQPKRRDRYIYFKYMQIGPWLVLFEWTPFKADARDLLERLAGMLGVDGCFFRMDTVSGWDELGCFESGEWIWEYTHVDGEAIYIDGVSPESLLKERGLLRADKRDTTISFEAYEALSDEEGEKRGAFCVALRNALPIDLYELGCNQCETLEACRIFLQRDPFDEDPDASEDDDEMPTFEELCQRVLKSTEDGLRKINAASVSPKARPKPSKSWWKSVLALIGL